MVYNTSYAENQQHNKTSLTENWYLFFLNQVLFIFKKKGTEAVITI